MIGYLPALGSSFLSDDYVLLTEAQLNRSALSVFTVDPRWWFYRPLGKAVWLSLYHLWGYWALGYHLVSLALHFAASLLVIALFRALDLRPPAIAPAAGLLYALLPLHVEAVVWLACLYDLLATCFYLATLLCLLIAWRDPRPYLFALSLASYQLCLWSKESAFTLPLMIPMVAWATRARPKSRSILGCMLAYALLTGVNLLQRYLAWGSFGGYANVAANRYAMVWDHLASAFGAMLAPLNRLAAPAELVQVWQLAMAGIVLAGLMAGGNRRMIALSLAWMALTLLPVLDLMPIGVDLQNSRLLYLPAVGFCLGLAALLDALALRLAGARRLRTAYLAVATLCAVYLVTLHLHIEPWLVAGRGAGDITAELHSLFPKFPPDSTLQIKDLPDNYQGAYIYRLGLDHAFGQRYGSLFRLEPVPKLPRLTYDPAGGNLYQVAFTFDAEAKRWKIAQARAATRANTSPAAPRSRTWSFGSGMRAAGWATQQFETQPSAGPGLELHPLDDDAYLVGPELTLPSGSWTEVVVRMAVIGNDDGQAAAQLFWATTDDPWWREERSQIYPLPSDGAAWSYHYFIPPEASGRAISRLRFDPLNTQNTVILQSITVRPIMFP